MVNFQDPAVVAQVYSVVVKLYHIFAGLYFWELVTTLDYEWSVIRGHRPYPRSIWLYSGSRVATLMSVILCIVSADVTTHYNCQAFVTFQFLFAFVSVAANSLLIVLRIMAIWNRRKVIVVISLAAWGTNVAILITDAVQFRSRWAPDEETCLLINVGKSTLNLIFTLTTEMFLLSVMFVGLLRMRRQGGGSFPLARFLWKQGLIWLFFAAIFEVPPIVFIIMNLNEPFDVIFQIPAMIALSIAVTRMHRSLVDFTSGSTEIIQEPTGCNVFPKTKQSAAVPIHHQQVEVTVHTDCEQRPMSQMSRESSCVTINTDGQRLDKPFELSFKDDLERGVKK